MARSLEIRENQTVDAPPTGHRLFLAEESMHESLSLLLAPYTNATISEKTAVYTWGETRRSLVFGRMPNAGWGIGIIDDESNWDYEDERYGKMRIIGERGDIVTVDDDGTVTVINTAPKNSEGTKIHHNSTNAHRIDSNGELTEGHIPQEEIMILSQRNIASYSAQS